MVKKWFWLGLLSLGLGICLFWSIESISPQGTVQKNLLSNKDAVADVLPPPLYIVESFLHINQYFQTEEQSEKKRLIEIIQKQQEEFNSRKLFWASNPFFKENPKKNYFEAVFESGEKIYQLFFKLAIDSNSAQIEKQQLFKKYRSEILEQFEYHRQKVGDLVIELNKQQLDLLDQSKLGLKQSRYIIFILILFFILISFMIGTAKIERSFFNIEQLWLPLLVAVFSYWVYGQLGQKLIMISTSIDDWHFLDLAFVGFITVFVARLMHNRHALMTEKILASEQKYRELLQNYSSDIVARLEAERKRISREIHDGIIQILGSVKFRLESARGKIQCETDYDRSLDLLQTAITDLRRLCHELRPSLLDQVGLIGAMHSLIEDFEFRTNILVIADFEFEDDQLAESERLELFRIFQELLTNCEKHSKATEINMHIYTSPSSLILDISDNGQGTELKKTGLPAHPGLGLINIQERIRSLNGIVELFSSVRNGFQVKIKIPLRKGYTTYEQQGTSSLNVSR
jgi:signal transduction histidine kinase